MNKMYALSVKLLGKMNDTSTVLMTACKYCAYQEPTNIKKPCKKIGKKSLVSSISRIAMNTSSFPKKQPNYGWINIVITHEDGATKLKIGTTVSNLLVTSSIRIDKNSITKNIVELGSTTSNFTATNDTKIYLNMESLRLGKMLAEDDSTTSIDVGNYFYQLRQLRSKFHCLSTYTLCRSSSTFAYDISYRPYTIWTLWDYDSCQQTDSQSQWLSQLFQTIATSVINNGILAQIKLDVLNDLCSKLKDGAGPIKYTIRIK